MSKATDQPAIQVDVTEEPAWKRVLRITVPTEAVDAEREFLLESMRKRLNLPGFRKGKVPKEMARKMLAGDLEQEVLQRLVPRAFQDALRQSGLNPLGDPHIDDLDFGPEKPLAFTATVEVLPEIEITGYEGLKVTRDPVDIDEEAVNRTLDAIRESRANLEKADRPSQGGDVLALGVMEVDEEGKPLEEGAEPTEMDLEIGGDRTPPSFTEELLGSVVGDMKTIPLPYPEDYPDPELAGRTRQYHVTVREVKEKVWPELDDALAKEVLGKDEATVDDLTTEIRDGHGREAEHRARHELENRIVTRLLELNEFELPDSLVATTLDNIVGQARQENPNLSDEEEQQLRTEYRPMVEGRYRGDILVDTVGRQEGIAVSEEDLDAEIAKFAERDGRPVEKIKAELRKEDGLGRLRRDLFRKRVIDTLVEKADVVEAPSEKENS
jgi:trigger factor